MRLKLRDGVLMTDTEYGLALLDVDSGRYWTLNPSGAVIVQKMVDGGSGEVAARALAELYDVDIDSATRDVRDLVDELRSAGLALAGEVSA